MAERSRKHLIDLNNPPARRQRRDGMSLSQVQKWVMSTLAVITMGHMGAGLVLAGLVMPADRLDARIGLPILGGAFGVLGVAAGLAIHQRRVLSPWLLIGLLPTAVGLWLGFGR